MHQVIGFQFHDLLNHFRVPESHGLDEQLEFSKVQVEFGNPFFFYVEEIFEFSHEFFLEVSAAVDDVLFLIDSI